MVLAYKTLRIAALQGTLREAKYHQGARLMPCRDHIMSLVWHKHHLDCASAHISFD